MLETIPKPPMEELDSYYESSEYISHTDSKKSIIDKVYQIVKKYTLNKKLKLINSFNTETKNLLDVGCGTGDFLATCNSNGWNVVGVEPNQSAKNLARQKISSSSKIHQNIFEIKLERFDVITLWHVLEHVPDLEEYISQLQKLLKPNGVLVVAVPNYKSFDAIHYKQFWAAYDVPRHLWHFSKKSIQLLFSKHKMRVSKILPMKFDAFYVSLLSEKYKTGKSNFLTAFFVGMQSNLKAMNKMNYSSLIYVIKSDKKSF
ncbi:MAG: class I SAM-dependent methyltransferase [Lutibacter sp.]|nr:class I SAM-dependent methyltransferase [Lutibacter sp.]